MRCQCRLSCLLYTIRCYLFATAVILPVFSGLRIRPQRSQRRAFRDYWCRSTEGIHNKIYVADPGQKVVFSLCAGCFVHVRCVSRHWASKAFSWGGVPAVFCTDCCLGKRLVVAPSDGVVGFSFCRVNAVFYLSFCCILELLGERTLAVLVGSSARVFLVLASGCWPACEQPGGAIPRHQLESSRWGQTSL